MNLQTPTGWTESSHLTGSWVDFPSFCLSLKYGMKIKWIFVGRISHLSSIKWWLGGCASFCKTANYLHWFNWLDRGLQTWCWKWENSQFHLAYMILEMTGITMYTSLIPWRFLDLWAQCQFSQGQRQQQKTLLETSGGKKGKKLKHSHVLFLQYLKEKTQPNS